MAYSTLILGLIQNIALLVALAAAYQVIAARLNRDTIVYRILSGLLFGGVGLVGMMTPLTFMPGIIFDGRSVILSVAGFICGPVAAGIAAVVCAAYRLYLGGPGVLMGVATIVQASAVGVGFHYLRRCGAVPMSVPVLWGFGVVVHVGTLALMVLLPREAGFEALRRLGPPIMIFYPVAVLLVCRLFLDYEMQIEDQRSLTESEARFRSLFHAAPISMALIAPRGAILDFNRSLERLFGYTAQDVPTLNEWWRLAYPDDEYRIRVKTAWEAAAKTAVEEHIDIPPVEYRITSKNGSERCVVISGVPVDHDILVAFEDVTDRRWAEEALKGSEERYRRVFENAAVGIDMVDDQGRFLEVNDVFARMLGYSKEELLKLTILDVTHPDDITPSRDNYGKMANRETDAYRFEKRYLKKDGEIMWADVSVSAFHADSACRRLGMGVIIDITERLALAKQLLQAQKMEAVGTLAGGVAHDFNNLLQVILGYADMGLLDTNEEHPAHEALTEIRRASRRAAELTQGLLSFSRMAETASCPVDLNGQVRAIAKMLERTMPKTVEITLNLTEPLDMIYADPTQLQQVIMNLALNARDAMPEGGKLAFETSNVILDEDYCKSHLETTPGKYTLLCVSDSGMGMDEQTRLHIFDPFFTTKEVGKGTGLGLAIAFGVVKSHGGHILCHSEPGCGSTFKIFLPAIMDARDEPANDQGAPTVTGGSETILLIDDEEPLRRLGRQTLSKAGYSVFTAADGREGVEVFRRLHKEIDLVILDVMMPVMGGQECLKALLELNPEVKVIIASGYPLNGPNLVDMAHHSLRTLKKPYDINLLLESVRTMLGTD